MDAVVAVVDDLLFVSRIREAARALGLEVRNPRRLEEVVAACRPAPRVVLVDLDSARLPGAEAVAAIRAVPELARVPVVGFFSHVHGERAASALAAGASHALPRSAFARGLPRILEDPKGS